MIILFVAESNVLHFPTSQCANELCEPTHKQWFWNFYATSSLMQFSVSVGLRWYELPIWSAYTTTTDMAISHSVNNRRGKVSVMNFGLVWSKCLFLFTGKHLHERPASVWTERITVTQSEEGGHTFDLFLWESAAPNFSQSWPSGVVSELLSRQLQAHIMRLLHQTRRSRMRVTGTHHNPYFTSDHRCGIWQPALNLHEKRLQRHTDTKTRGRQDKRSPLRCHRMIATN